jgi:PIN domain nuclease of toxin-antitoxin system
VKLLLDTHAFVWWTEEALPAEVTDAFYGAAEIFVSVASVWEIGIKRSIGKMRFDAPIVRSVADEGFDLLAITGDHAEEAGALPRLHGDPFDRLLIAQARVEGLTIVSRDRAFDLYDVAVQRC